MTFGSVVKLYKSIDNIKEKKSIARFFGVGKVSVFESYIDAIYTLRNKCAHGAALFDLQLPNGISSKGPKLGLEGGNHQKLVGALTVLGSLKNRISRKFQWGCKKKVKRIFVVICRMFVA